ncbi:MAG: hypothetical protein SGILL_003352 [Bacillariaceae sp.]
MGSIAVSQFADKILNACCGDKADAVISQLPLKKDDDTEEMVEDVEEKKEDMPAPAVEEKVTETKKTVAFTDVEMKYELTLWKDLPADARAAAEEIGYDESKWDDHEEVHIGDEPWHHLSESQVKAVTTLGWDENSWESYEHFAWEDLPKAAQTACEISGLKWDGHPHEQPDHLEHSHWDELSDDDKACMAVLGYTKHAWDH